MSFANDLWNGFETVCKRTDEGLKACKEVATFFKKRSEIEGDYGKSLLSLCKTTSGEKFSAKKLIKGKGGGSGPLDEGTVRDSWVTVQTEVEKLARVHSDFSQKLINEVVEPINNFIKEKEASRKMLLLDGGKATKILEDTVSNYQKAKQRAEKLAKEAEQSQQGYHKATTDDTVKPDAIQKLASKVTQAKEKASQADGEYRETVVKANEIKDKFHSEQMPQILSELQKLEEERIKFLKTALKQFIDLQDAIPPSIKLTCEAMTQYVDAIDVDADVQTFIEENRSEAEGPEPIEYVPFTEEGASQAASAAGTKKGPNIAEFFKKIQRLSPEERTAKLQEKLAETDNEIKNKMKTKSSMENMAKLYEKDPEQKKKVDLQLEQFTKDIEQLQDTRQKVEQELKSSGVSVAPAPAVTAASSAKPPGATPKSPASAAKKAKALYDYKGEGEEELSFAKGDQVTVFEVEDSGWWQVELKGHKGIVPGNYFEYIQ